MINDFSYNEFIDDLSSQYSSWIKDKYKGKLPPEVSIDTLIEKILEYGMEEKFIDQDIFSHNADGQYLLREKDCFLSIYRERGMVLMEEKFNNIEDGLKEKLQGKYWWL
ncbi:MAG: hypothetical protein VX642_13455 [Bdellovibrionota bacterium]|nr:hypothetical protein [Bdellovibrionota bacterium]